MRTEFTYNQSYHSSNESRKKIEVEGKGKLTREHKMKGCMDKLGNNLNVSNLV